MAYILTKKKKAFLYFQPTTKKFLRISIYELDYPFSDSRLQKFEKDRKKLATLLCKYFKFHSPLNITHRHDQIFQLTAVLPNYVFFKIEQISELFREKISKKNLNNIRELNSIAVYDPLGYIIACKGNDQRLSVYFLALDKFRNEMKLHDCSTIPTKTHQLELLESLKLGLLVLDTEKLVLFYQINKEFISLELIFVYEKSFVFPKVTCIRHGNVVTVIERGANVTDWMIEKFRIC